MNQFFTLSTLWLLALPPTRALVMEEARPGVLPSLMPDPEGLPGGKRSVDLNDRARYERLQHLVQIAMDVKQERDHADNLPNYVHHKLTKISEATEQLVQGKIYQIKFFVGEKDCQTAHTKHRGCLVKPDGQFGECFYEIRVELGNSGLQIQHAVCAKSTKQSAE